MSAEQHVDYHLKPLDHQLNRQGPVVFCILDGYGLGKNDAAQNPIVVANPVHINGFMDDAKAHNLYMHLKAHGAAVGLPSEADMGNSEVGHNAMGCGQIYNQGTALVDQSFSSGRMFHTENWNEVVTETAHHNGTLHLFGLLSDGNIHSHMRQVFLLLDGAVESGIKKLRLHILLDGRDVSPTSGLTYVDQLEEKLLQLRNEKHVDAMIASGGGRMCVTMDRYNSDWTIVQRGWETMAHGVVMPSEITDKYSGYFHSAREAVECARAVFPEKQDQYNPPFVVVDAANKPVGVMQDGDACINWNFRGDRAVEISRCFTDEEFPYFNRGTRPTVTYAGLLEYDTEIHIPHHFLVPPPEIHNTLSQFMVASHLSSYAVAETHKYGHVTFFWNGNKSGYLDQKYEKFELVESLPNSQTESHPEMKAPEVNVKLMEAVRSNKYKFIRVNFANPDMVGHTGNFESCVRAIQCLDGCVDELIRAVREVGGVLIITADHGNVESKDHQGGKTSHTCAPVPFGIMDSGYNGEYTLFPEGSAPADTDGKGAGLSNIASTILNLLGYEAPAQYRKSLLRYAQ